MMASPSPDCGFRFSAAIVERVVGLYHCFNVSLRDIKTILATRGVVVSHG